MTIEIKTTIKDFITNNLLQISLPHIDEDTNLIAEGLDSLKMMRLVVFLEETFAITIHDQDVNAENMANLNQINQLVNSYLCTKP